MEELTHSPLGLLRIEIIILPDVETQISSVNCSKVGVPANNSTYELLQLALIFWAQYKYFAILLHVSPLRELNVRTLIKVAPDSYDREINLTTEDLLQLISNLSIPRSTCRKFALGQSVFEAILLR